MFYRQIFFSLTLRLRPHPSRTSDFCPTPIYVYFLNNRRLVVAPSDSLVWGGGRFRLYVRMYGRMRVRVVKMGRRG